ncbi:MAG: MoaD/ThiS family protein [Chloroflexi bacterium]|nr:MoaD/ThiS family protein [Chloroflexota bacterium]
MNVIIEPIGPLRRHLEEGHKSATVTLPDGATVTDALSALGVSEDAQWNASIEGQLVYGDAEVSDGDHLLVFSPIEGG